MFPCYVKFKWKWIRQYLLWNQNKSQMNKKANISENIGLTRPMSNSMFTNDSLPLPRFIQMAPQYFFFNLPPSESKDILQNILDNGAEHYKAKKLQKSPSLESIPEVTASCVIQWLWRPWLRVSWRHKLPTHSPVLYYMILFTSVTFQSSHHQCYLWVFSSPVLPLSHWN